MQYTRNYNLKKPDYTDFADIEDINDNMDKLDEELAAPTGDSADSTTTFTTSDTADGGATAWTNVPALTSGETHKSLFAKMSQMFKNIRYLYKMLGTTDISSIGDGTVTKALSVLNANFGKMVISDSQLDALMGTCFFSGLVDNSSYFGSADFNGVQIDAGAQRTQIAVSAKNLKYRVDDDGSGHTGAWTDWYDIPYDTLERFTTVNNIIADLKAATRLTINRTEQEHVTAVSLNRCSAFKCGGILFFRGNLEISYANGLSDFVKIGNISGWSGIDAIFTNVPAQNDGSKVVLISIATNGDISIYSATSFAGMPFFRFTMSIGATN